MNKTGYHRTEEFIQLVREHQPVTSSEFADIINVPARTARWQLQQAFENNRLTRRPHPLNPRKLIYEVNE